MSRGLGDVYKRQVYSEDIDIKDLEKYFLASSQGQAPCRFLTLHFSTWGTVTGLVILVAQVRKLYAF